MFATYAALLAGTPIAYLAALAAGSWRHQPLIAGAALIVAIEISKVIPHAAKQI